MSTNTIALWKSAAEAFEQRHQAVTDAHLTLGTPCDDFDVQALIRHAVDTQISIGGLLGANTTEAASWEPTRDAVAAALASPGVLDGDAEHPGLGTTAKSRLLEIATHDLVVHTWDLSQAIGVDATLPTANLKPATQSILAFPEGVRAALFAAPGDLNGAEDLQARLLAVAGRLS